MSEILSAPAIYLIWLAAFALSIALAGTGLWAFFVRKGRVPPVAWAVWSAAAVLPICLSFWDIFHRLDPGFVGPFVLVFETVVLAAAGIGCYVLGMRRRETAAIGGRKASTASKPAPTRRLSWVLVGLTGLAAVWTSHRFYECISVDDSAYEWSLSTWLPRPAEDAQALTDQGGSINLYSPAANPAVVVPNRDALDAAEARHFVDRRIKRRDPSRPANCHGWVFTGGRYCLSPDDVEKILVENGYRAVTRPKPGDLIIYRDEDGNIVHSGLVRLADGDLVLVESQWGPKVRYLHEPAEQAYSSRFTYYRSPRGGHLVRIEGPAREL